MTGVTHHATCVGLKTRSGDWRGVLLQGASGSGKSDLALRLIQAVSGREARLVADDYVLLVREGSDLVAHAPQAIAGLLEVRGLGVVRRPALDRVPVALAFDLTAREAVERMPLPRRLDLEALEPGLTAGLEIPLYALAPFDSAACEKVWLTFSAVMGEVEVISNGARSGPLR